MSLILICKFLLLFLFLFSCQDYQCKESNRLTLCFWWCNCVVCVDCYRPEEIENYIHRIGRTGRCGKTGVATTFINATVEESILLDLKGVLIEAKQHIPPVLDRLQHPHDEMSEELRKALDEDAEKDGLARGCTFSFFLFFVAYFRWH